MKNGLVISDAGPIFSLAILDKLELLDTLFDEVFIPKAVWEELNRDKTTDHYQKVFEFFEDKVKEIAGFNELAFIMDYGESESLMLYKELGADFLLIDDKKARSIAEHLKIQCIGTLGILSIARERELVESLRPLFETLLENKRYYSLKLLNAILQNHHEKELDQKK